MIKEGNLRITYLDEFKLITNNLLLIEEMIDSEDLSLNKRVATLKKRIEQNLNFISSLTLVSSEKEDQARVESALKTAANDLIKLLVWLGLSLTYIYLNTTLRPLRHRSNSLHLSLKEAEQLAEKGEYEEALKIFPKLLKRLER